MTLASLLYRAPAAHQLRPVSGPQSKGDLDKYSHSGAFESRGPSPLPALSTSATEISRPSSTSTQASYAAGAQQPHHTHKSHQTLPFSQTSLSLPGLSALASIASAPSSQLSSLSSHATPSMNYASSSPATASLAGNTPPICQNCQTSTTPLWRRDEMGSVLCNACGLFLKLHGRPRPISLKTNVIKSRNRVRTTANAQRKKPSNETDSLPASVSEAEASSLASHTQRRASPHKICSGASDRSHSLSRTHTPSTQHDPNIAPQHLFDGASLIDQPFQPSPALPALHLNPPSLDSTASATDRHLEPPQTYEQLLKSNNQLKTRVNELELINMMRLESELRLQKELESSRRAEDDLKRHIGQLEQGFGHHNDSGRHAERASKRFRLADEQEPQ